MLQWRRGANRPITALLCYTVNLYLPAKDIREKTI